MPEESSLGKRIKKARNRLHWTQQQLADELQVSRLTVIRWEKDDQHPVAYYLKKLITLLGLDEKEDDAPSHAAAQAPQEIENLPLEKDNLPFKQNPFFTGRETELERLRKQLQETGTAAITQSISITGLGGIGKTELALEFAHSSYPIVYRAALWVNAADERTLQASYGKLAEMLMPERNEQELYRRVQAVKDWLKEHTNWLLIMDNADDLPLAESFLPAKPLGHVVFTTRSQDIDNIAANQIDVDKMKLEDGLALILLRSHKLQVDADTRKSALEVVELLGGHPLALDQAGAYINETGVSFTDYIKRYHTERRKLLNRRRSLKSKDSEHTRHPLPVAATLKLSIEDAGAQHSLATDILNFCAFLHHDAIPEELFQHDDGFKYDTTEFDEAVAVLHSHSLIKRDTHEQTFSMHRLVQAVLIDATPPDLQKQWRDRVLQALIAAVPEVDSNDFGRYFERSRWERLLPHVLPCATWMEDEFTPTVGVAKLFHKAARILSGRGQYSVEETLLVRALSILETHLGAEFPYAVISPHIFAILDTALAILDIAKSLRLLGFGLLGNDEQAESVLVRALSIQLKYLGAEHPDVAESLHMLAWRYHEQGKYEQAELLYRQALKIFEKYLDGFHGINPPLIGLSELLHKKGKYEQTESLLQYALSIQEQRLGATHHHTKAARGLYAYFLHSMGRDTEAAALGWKDTPTEIRDNGYAVKIHYFCDD